MYEVKVLNDTKVIVDGYVFERYGDPVETTAMSIRLAALATYYWKEQMNVGHAET